MLDEKQARLISGFLFILLKLCFVVELRLVVTTSGVLVFFLFITTVLWLALLAIIKHFIANQSSTAEQSGSTSDDSATDEVLLKV